MNNYFALTKTLIINTFRPLTKAKKNLHKTIIFFLLIGLALVPLEIGTIKITAASFRLLRRIGQEGLVLSLGLSAVSSVIFLFGIFYVISAFYFSKDIENFIALPLRPWEILAAKFTITLLYEYITEVLFLLPIVITYGIMSSSGFLFYIYLLLIFISLPIIPLILSSILDILIMSATSLAKSKDSFKLFAGITAVLLAMGLNIFAQKYALGSINQNQLINLLLSGHNSAVSLTSKLFPSAKYGVQALLNINSVSGLLNLLAFLEVNLIFLLIFTFLGNLLYFKGIIGSSETAKKKHKTVNNTSTKIVQKSALNSYTSKELKLLMRTPIYFLNCVLMNFIWPVFVFIPILFNPEATQKLGMLRHFLQNTRVEAIVIAIMAAAGVFISAANGITSTAISREGQNLFVSKYLPIKFELQILAKVLSGVYMGTLGITFIIISAAVMFKPSIYLIILCFIIGILGIFLTAFSGILIDLNYPKLVWDNEQKAVKQNLNVLLNMLIGAITSGLIILSTVKLIPDMISSFVYILIALGIADFILYKVTLVKGKILFYNIES